MAKDLRSFISQLVDRDPQEIVTVSREVDPTRFEATAIMLELIKRRKYPAVLFEQVKNIKGSTSYARLLLHALASHRKCEVALDLNKVSRLELIKEYMAREDKRIKPLVVPESQAPVREVVRRGRDIDLAELPILRHFEMDGNPYLDTAVIARDADYGYNAAFLRMMYLDRNHTAIHMAPRHHWTYLKKREEKGQAMPIAVVIGHHPAFYLGSLTLAPIESDEYDIIGGMLGEPLRLVPSAAYGDELMVPADAEIILEGEIVPDMRVVEGPFAEWTGYYGPQRLRWLVEVKAITHRRDPIYYCSLTGQLVEDNYLNLATEAGLLKEVKKVVPSVKAVACMGRGFRFNVVIALEKRMEGEPVSAALSALAVTDYAKNVIVVDKDIDPWNLPDVMWAVSTRTQPARDVTIVKGKKGSVLDPSTEHEVATSAMIIDATIPLAQPFQQVVDIPAWVKEKVRLEDYIPWESLAGAQYEGTLV